MQRVRRGWRGGGRGGGAEVCGGSRAMQSSSADEPAQSVTPLLHTHTSTAHDRAHDSTAGCNGTREAEAKRARRRRGVQWRIDGGGWRWRSSGRTAVATAHPCFSSPSASLYRSVHSDGRSALQLCDCAALLAHSIWCLDRGSRSNYARHDPTGCAAAIAMLMPASNRCTLLQLCHLRVTVGRQRAAATDAQTGHLPGLLQAAREHKGRAPCVRADHAVS